MSFVSCWLYTLGVVVDVRLYGVLLCTVLFSNESSNFPSKKKKKKKKGHLFLEFLDHLHKFLP
jgi:hypothetical protein